MIKVNGNAHADTLKGGYKFCFFVPNGTSKKSITKEIQKRIGLHINYKIEIVEEQENTPISGLENK